MKKLIIVGTKADVGRGGISTALTGYIEGLKLNNVDFEIIESHIGEANTLVQWFKAKILVTKLALKYRSNAVFWFHCGPWLSLLRKFSLAVIVRTFGSTAIGHIHSPTFNQYLTNSRLSRILVKLAVFPYSAIIVLTPWWRKLLIEHGITKNTYISPNPNNSFSCQMAQHYREHPRELLEKNAEINILSMGRMVDGKGIEEVLHAMTFLPENYKLTVAGDGNKLKTYKALAKSLKLAGRVEFTGWVDGALKDKLLRSADIFCLPSTYDSFGMVFIEAMAYELPVVAYGWGPIPDVVTKDVGICCEQVTPEKIAQAIEKATENYKHYLGNGPESVLTNYMPEVVAKNIIALLRE